MLFIGNPGIMAHLVLQNRQHVLTKDTTGEVALWDLVRVSRENEKKNS